MGRRPGLRDVLRRPVLEQEHSPGTEDPHRLGDDGTEIGHVVDQGPLEDDVSATVVETGGRRIARPESDAGEIAVLFPGADQLRLG